MSAIRRLLTPVFAATLALAAACSEQKPQAGAFTPVPVTPVLGDVPIGDANAPVTMLEYAALTCSHCRDFWKWELPKLKSQYLDTGRVKLIYRDFPIDEAGMGVLFASVSRCGGEAKYVDMVDEFFTRQYDLLTSAQSGSALPVLNEIGAKFGLSPEQVMTCIDHQPDLKASILKSQQDASAKGVRGTPTVFINDELVANPTWENIVAAIEAKLGNPAPAAVAPASTPATPAPADAPGATPPASPPT
ncbi:MAG: thioredoxin domain-containing protein [Hyphomonadaceae bacterium]|nr:thioredoxin domain-containing protein [Hyphomonadaceae bacterium]